MSDWEKIFLTHVGLEEVLDKAVPYHHYFTSMMREATVDTQDGVSVGGHMINAIR